MGGYAGFGGLPSFPAGNVPASTTFDPASVAGGTVYIPKKK